MRGLWTQIPRPRLKGSSSLSSIDSTTSILVRKTTTRPLRRRPGFNDAFTVLLAPVLAAAFIVDNSWKAKQRKDWDEKLSVIQEEINVLREREQRIWSSLQLRSIRNGLVIQRRGYATAAHALVHHDEIPNDFNLSIWEDDTFLQEMVSVGPKTPSGPAEAPKEVLNVRRVFTGEEFSHEQMLNFHRYHRLNAVSLALRMLIHLQIGPSPFFSITAGDDPVDSEANEFPQDASRLAEMLALTRKQLRPLKNYNELYRVAPQIQAEASRGPLNQIMRNLTEEFDRGNISLPGLIDGFGKAILQTNEVPSVSVYIMLIRSLSKVGSHSLGYLAVAALKKSTLPLSDEAVFYMLFQIGKACDSRSLNHILAVIAKSDNQLNLTTKWEKAHINGLDIPVPTVMNPRLLQVLVFTALRCEQPERAEAWLTLLREADYGGVWKDDLFRSFLAYYSAHGNWEEGKKWIQRSVNHASAIGARSTDRLARVIYRMLDLCVRCRRLPEYTTLLDAAVTSGIGAPLVNKTQNDRRPFHPRARSILLEWEALPLADDVRELTGEEKTRLFQQACQPLIEEISGKPTAAQHPPEDLELGSEHQDQTKPRFSLRYAVRIAGEPTPAGHAEDLALSQKTTAEIEQMQTRFAQQDAHIVQLKTKLALADSRQKAFQEAERERASMWSRTSSELHDELRESRDAVQKLHNQNITLVAEHAELRQEISDLKAIASRLIQQQQQQTEKVVEKEAPEVASKPPRIKKVSKHYFTIGRVSSTPQDVRVSMHQARPKTHFFKGHVAAPPTSVGVGG